MEHPLETILFHKEQSFGQRVTRPLGENHVFRIGDRYYKFPNYARLFHDAEQSYYHQAQKKLDFVVEHFSDLMTIPETRIYKWEDSYFIEQKAVQGEVVGIHHLKQHPHLIDIIAAVVKRNDEIWDLYGNALDLSGTDVLLDPLKLHNIITDGKHLYPIDIVGLLHKAGNSHFLYETISKGVFPLQQNIIKGFLKMSS